MLICCMTIIGTYKYTIQSAYYSYITEITDFDIFKIYYTTFNVLSMHQILPYSLLGLLYTVFQFVLQ